VRAKVKHVIDRSGSNRALARVRALLRSNEFYLIPLALVVGAVTGANVTLMSEVAQVAHVFIYGIPIDVRLSANAFVNPWVALIAPTLGGLSLGFMEWSRRRMKIADAVDPVEANALRGGLLSLRDSVVVSSQTLISNGCGASVGLEAGYTQIGSGVASLLGQFLNLRRNDLRLIVGCGAAAAIAAAFGAPITGAFFACELIVGVYSVGSAAPILASSLAAAITAQWLGGAPYSLEVPRVGAVGVEQYITLILLALITAAVGIAVMRSAPFFERLFTQPRIPSLDQTGGRRSLHRWYGDRNAASPGGGTRSHAAGSASRDGHRPDRPDHRLEADCLSDLAGVRISRWPFLRIAVCRKPYRKILCRRPASGGHGCRSQSSGQYADGHGNAWRCHRWRAAHDVVSRA
jgi:Voltage gated chloride channel